MDDATTRVTETGLSDQDKLPSASLSTVEGLQCRFNGILRLRTHYSVWGTPRGIGIILLLALFFNIKYQNVSAGYHTMSEMSGSSNHVFGFYPHTPAMVELVV